MHALLRLEFCPSRATLAVAAAAAGASAAMQGLFFGGCRLVQPVIVTSVSPNARGKGERRGRGREGNFGTGAGSKRTQRSIFPEEQAVGVAFDRLD